MSIAAPPVTRLTSERYFALIDEGVFGPDDKVELLEGVVVEMPPEGPRHEAAIYAAAGIPEYWIVNLRDDVIEVSRSPDREAGRYTETRIARRGERLELVALPGASVGVDDLLPEA